MTRVCPRPWRDGQGAGLLLQPAGNQPAMLPPRKEAAAKRRHPEHPRLAQRCPPVNTALPKLRAGLTEALETGMAMTWMAVSDRPIAIGAKPAPRASHP